MKFFTVRIRKWEDLIKEFGTINMPWSYGDVYINTDCLYSSRIEEILPKNRIIKINERGMFLNNYLIGKDVIDVSYKPLDMDRIKKLNYSGGIFDFGRKIDYEKVTEATDEAKEFLEEHQQINSLVIEFNKKWFKK